MNLDPVLKKILDPDYKDREEKRVITGSEWSLTTKLGENGRKDHFGTHYRVSGPMSR